MKKLYKTQLAFFKKMVTLRFKSNYSPTVITSDDKANVEMNDFAKFDGNNNVLERKGNLGQYIREVYQRSNFA